MAIRPLNDDLNIIAALPDEPTDSSAVLKATFDEAGNTIKDYINTSMIPDIGADIAAAVASAEIHSGNIPSGGTTGQIIKKKTNTDYDFGWADMTGTSAPTPNTFVLRDGDGRFQAANPSAAQDVATKNYVTDLSIPVGTIQSTVAASLGEKWGLCNGAGVTQAQYPELYSILKASLISSAYTTKSAGANAGGWTKMLYGNGVFATYNYSISTLYWTTDPINGTWTAIPISLSGMGLNVVGSTNALWFCNGNWVLIGTTSSPYNNGMGYAYCSNLASPSWSIYYIAAGLNPGAMVWTGTFYVFFFANGSNYWNCYRTNNLQGTWIKAWDYGAAGSMDSWTVIDGYIFANFKYSLGVWASDGSGIFWDGIGNGSSWYCSQITKIESTYYAVFNNDADTSLSVFFKCTGDPISIANWSSFTVPYPKGRGLYFIDGRYYLCTNSTTIYYSENPQSVTWQTAALPGALSYFHSIGDYFLFGSTSKFHYITPKKSIPLISNGLSFIKLKP